MIYESPDDWPLHSWLKRIQKADPNTSVMIVATHADEIEASGRSLKDVLDQIQANVLVFKKEGMKLCSAHVFSYKNNKSIGSITKAIIDNSLKSAVGGMGTAIRRGVAEVEQMVAGELAKLSGNLSPYSHSFIDLNDSQEDEPLPVSVPPLLPYNRFFSFCQLSCLKEREKVDETLKLLHNWGVVIDSNKLGISGDWADYIFLSPTWFVERLMEGTITVDHDAQVDGSLESGTTNKDGD